MTIKGITVTLCDKQQVGVDEFGVPIYIEEMIPIQNVLVAPSSTDDIVENLNLYGKKAIYTLAIPKGDNHIWEDRKVVFFKQVFHTFGFPIEGIEENIPLSWNKKIMVERYG